MQRLITGFMLTAILTAPLWAQTSAQSHPSRLKALTLLNKARKSQLKSEGKLEITSFEGHFQVTFFDHSDPKGKATQNAGQIRQYWASRLKKDKRETRYRRDMGLDINPGETLVLASDWDDLTWTQKVKDGKKERLQLMQSKKYERDRKELLAEKRRIDDLFRIFVLDNLPVNKQSLRVFEENKTLALTFGSRTKEYVTTEIQFLDQQQNRYRLWLRTDKKKDGEERVLPVKAKIRFRGRGAWETFTMDQYFKTPLGPKKGSLLVPCNVIYHDAQGRQVLILSTAKPETAFRFNQLDKKRQRKLFPVIE